MKKAFFAIVAIAATVFCGATQSFAVQDSGLVAVLDIVRVFRENAAHDSEMKRIDEAAQAVKAQVEQQLTQMRSEAEKIQAMEFGSPERNSLEAELEQQQTALRTMARQKELDLLAEEARIYFRTWTQMQQVITEIAQHPDNNISLVLRFDSQEIDPTNREEVIKGVNRSVIYHDRLDITDLVIERMGARVAQAAGPSVRK